MPGKKAVVNLSKMLSDYNINHCHFRVRNWNLNQTLDFHVSVPAVVLNLLCNIHGLFRNLLQLHTFPEEKCNRYIFFTEFSGAPESSEAKYPRLRSANLKENNMLVMPVHTFTPMKIISQDTSITAHPGFIHQSYELSHYESSSES